MPILEAGAIRHLVDVVRDTAELLSGVLQPNLPRR